MLVSHDIQCAALRQLETALRLYFECEDYYSVVTLAGASEEILGKLLEEKNLENKKLVKDKDLESARKLLEDVPEEFSEKLLEGPDTSFVSDKKATCEVYEQLYKKPLEEKDAGKVANYIKNRLKHWSSGQPKSFEADAPAEAEYMLDRAIYNYYHLTGDETPTMRTFRESQVKDIVSMPPEGYRWPRLR